ncbi:MAG: FtsX-like permease family protein, partial [Bacteroidota bacterium]
RIVLNRIYPDYNKEWAITAPILTPTLQKEVPEVEHYTRISWDDMMLGKVGDRMEKQRITAVDSGFFQMFDAKVLSGVVSNEMFKKNDQIVMTETAAKKYFGKEEAVGQLFNLQLPNDEKRLVSVAAVISDPKPTTHFSYEVLGTLEMLKFPDFVMNIWGIWAVYSYIKVHPDADPGLLREKINALSAKNQSIGDDSFQEWLDAGNLYDYSLQPLTSIHLQSNLNEEFEANSSQTYLYFFALVGVFILIMAVVNFVNMATARASYRTQEVGIRKTVGASKSDLLFQFLLESTLISLISMALALLITQITLPLFNESIGKSITLELFTSPVAIGILIVSPFLLGLLSGFYPALYLSNFSPVAIFQKLIVRRGKENLRHLLVVGQFMIAVTLMICTLTVFNQMYYLSNKPLGFNKEQLIKIDRLPFAGDKIDLFKERATKVPGVERVATTSFPLDQVREGSTIRPKDNANGWVNTTTLSVDEHFVPATGIQLVAGRNFRSDEVETTEGVEKIILNVSAAKALGWKPQEAVDKSVAVGDQEYRLVIGVAEDFNFDALHRPTVPFQLSGRKFVMLSRSAIIRIDPRNMNETLADLEELWSEFSPDIVFDYQFVDEAMAQYYEAERLTGKLFVIFSGLGIFICCLGLFGLMGFVVEKRAKEVGVRKVLGARISHIVLLLSKDYIRLVVIASAIAIPIAWWGLNQWLDTFANRIEHSIWTFLLAGFLVAIISWLTVAFYSYQAAKSNPVKSLRSE